MNPYLIPSRSINGIELSPMTSAYSIVAPSKKWTLSQSRLYSSVFVKAYAGCRPSNREAKNAASAVPLSAHFLKSARSRPAFLFFDSILASRNISSPIDKDSFSNASSMVLCFKSGNSWCIADKRFRCSGVDQELGLMVPIGEALYREAFLYSSTYNRSRVSINDLMTFVSSSWVIIPSPEMSQHWKTKVIFSCASSPGFATTATAAAKL
mmetsp:Transcript_23086/g.46306  ORF Transcript_23086/g.46306 Transcript_23086/m.46306 type:complete len:210 (+) Transcript_23086:186-815(+)